MTTTTKTGFDMVITVTGDDLQVLSDELTQARSVRFAIDDGGLKVSVDRGVWTLPLGQVIP